MACTTTPTEGDVFRITVAEQDGDVLVPNNREYDLQLLGSPHLEKGTCKEITVTVTNTWYSSSGELAVVFLSTNDETAKAPISARRRGEEDSKGSTRLQSENRISSDSASPNHSVDPESIRYPQASNCANRSLQDIADELIGQKEFTLTADENSSVSAAKERAKKQGRDPAIDPNLPDS